MLQWAGHSYYCLPEKDQVITLLFLITIMLITAVNRKKQGGQGKSVFI